MLIKPLATEWRKPLESEATESTDLQIAEEDSQEEEKPKYFSLDLSHLAGKIQQICTDP